jgi:hypothetical protein
MVLMALECVVFFVVTFGRSNLCPIPHANITLFQLPIICIIAGWTMFVQRKVMKLLRGAEAAEFDAVKGLKALTDSVDHFGCEHCFTSLLPDLTGVDPDDAFSSVPYVRNQIATISSVFVCA